MRKCRFLNQHYKFIVLILIEQFIFKRVRQPRNTFKLSSYMFETGHEFMPKTSATFA